LKEQLAELNSSVEVYQAEQAGHQPTVPMIPLGLKETKELELEDVFRELIESHYYEDGADYDEALAELTDLRQAMRTPTRDRNGTALLFQYYNQLYFVERRFFPPDRSSGLHFEGYDSLTGVPCTQKTVAFERAAVLFNIGGLYTQVHSLKGSLGVDLLTLEDGDEAQPKHRRGARECRGQLPQSSRHLSVHPGKLLPRAK
jgi:hypothetical protein